MESKTKTRTTPGLVRAAYWLSQNADVPRWLFYSLMVSYWLLLLLVLLDVLD